MRTEAYTEIIRAAPKDRSDVFLRAATRLSTDLIYIEKDFWACWVLNTLFHRLPDGGPRLLFKGGTSLSKGYGLINRFSEDIDVTVFRDDLGHHGDTADLAALSNTKRRAVLDSIEADCKRFITTDLLAAVAEALDADTRGQGRVEIDPKDPNMQALLVWYPRVSGSPTGYVTPAVKIELSAKSALEPNRSLEITPYITDDFGMPGLSVPDVTTIHAERTFWDKIVIAHGYLNWFERRGKMYREGHRISRHYYDLHSLIGTEVGSAAISDRALGKDCFEHSHTFYRRKDYGLENALQGQFRLMPEGEYAEGIARDYVELKSMVFGDAPDFEDILMSIRKIEEILNSQE